jgi:hypothetical protein
LSDVVQLGVTHAADYIVGQDASPAAGVHVGVFVLGYG